MRTRPLSLLLVAGACNLDTYGQSGAETGGTTPGSSSSENSTGSNVPTSGIGTDPTSGAGTVDTTGGETLTGGSTQADGTSSSDDTAQDSTGTSDSSSTDASTGEECVEEETIAAENTKRPADILFVIDNSGSMDFEESAVQDNMNAFSSKISESDVDAHVVLLSNYDICIGPPLGSGGCPGSDTNLPQFRHVDQAIGSNDGLQQLLNRKADWMPSMRPDGVKHVVIVSDNDSALAANSFHAMFTAFGPAYVDYKFHAIVGLWDYEDFGKCAADPVCCAVVNTAGVEYAALVGLTGGVLGALCDNGQQNFAGLFDTLSTGVVVDACGWLIPDPMNMAIDFDEINVDFDDGMGPEAIPRVDDLAACGELEAWYYDDPDAPTKIVACPALCMKVQDSRTTSIDVKFGCPSIVP